MRSVIHNKFSFFMINTIKILTPTVMGDSGRMTSYGSTYVAVGGNGYTPGSDSVVPDTNHTSPVCIH
jgi:hypothetical protein